MFHCFHMKVGQFLLHITTQTASVQVRRFSAAIYQWRPSSNTSRRRFPLLSVLFFEKNTVFGTIPRTTVLCSLVLRDQTRSNEVARNKVARNYTHTQDGQEARIYAYGIAQSAGWANLSTSQASSGRAFSQGLNWPDEC